MAPTTVARKSLSIKFMMRTQLLKRIWKNPFFLTFLAMVTITILIFRFGFVSGGDAFYPVFSKNYFRTFFDLWNPTQNLGQTSIDSANFVYYAFWAFFSYFHLSPHIVQIIWFIFLNSLTITWFYLLSRRLGQIFDIKISGMTFFLVGLFYLFNPIIFISYLQSSYMLAYSFLPFLFYALIKLFYDFDKKYIYIMPLVSLLYSYVGVNPPIYAACLIMPTLLFLILVCNNAQKIKKIMLYFLPTALLFLLINSFWLYPMALILSKPTGLQANVDLSWPVWTSINATYLNILQFIGSWSLGGYSFGSKNTLFDFIYFSKWYSLISFIFLSLVLFAFYKTIYQLVRKKLLYYLLLALAVLVLIMLSGGMEGFSGRFYSILYLHAPFFWLFREPWAKFMLIYILLINIFFLIVFSEKYFTGGRTIKYLTLTSFTLLIVANVYIGISGLLIPGDRGNYPGLRVTIPDYLRNYSLDQCTYGLSDKTDRLLFYPRSPFYQVHLFWPNDGYYGSDPLLQASCADIVTVGTGGGYIGNSSSLKLINALYDSLNAQDWVAAKNFLRVLNIDKILARNDLDYTQVGSDLTPKAEMKNALKEGLNLSEGQKFGTIKNSDLSKDQYYQSVFSRQVENIDDQPALEIYPINLIGSGEVYSPKRMILGVGGSELIYPILSDNIFSEDSAFLLNDNEPVKVDNYYKFYLTAKNDLQRNNGQAFTDYNRAAAGKSLGLQPTYLSSEEFVAAQDSDSQKAEFSFTVDQPATYALINSSKNELLEFDYERFKTAQVYLDGNSLMIQPRIIGNKIIIRSENFNQAGSHQLKIIFSQKDYSLPVATLERGIFNSNNTKIDNGIIKINVPDGKKETLTVPIDLKSNVSYVVRARSKSNNRHNLALQIVQDIDKKLSAILTDQGKKLDKGQEDDIMPGFELGLFTPDSRKEGDIVYSEVFRPNAMAKQFALRIKLDNTAWANKQLGHQGDLFADISDIEFIPIDESYVYLEQINNYSVTANNIDIKSTKLNSSKYLVNISSEDSGVYPLILAESYDKNWKIFRRDKVTAGKPISFYETWFKKPLDEGNHFVANGYANGWYSATDQQNGNNSEYIIEYIPQRFYILFLTVSAVGAIVCVIGYVIVNRRRKYV